MFCNLSPLAVHTNETLNSLRFATKVRIMQVSPHDLESLYSGNRSIAQLLGALSARAVHSGIQSCYLILEGTQAKAPARRTGCLVVDVNTHNEQFVRKRNSGTAVLYSGTADMHIPPQGD